MKKITSLLLALVMVFSMSTVAFASDDYETLVSYTGDGVSAYEVTVPATLAPGGSGKVKVSGTWATNMTVNVTAPETVTLTNDIDGSTKVLDVEFDGISQAGDNTNSILVNATISVEQITNALFGTWSGTIVYTVSAEDNGSGDSGSEYTLSGTWLFNETLSVPESSSMEQQIVFTTLVSSDPYEGIKVSISQAPALPGTTPETIINMSYGRNNFESLNPVYGNPSWFTADYQTVEFGSEPQVVSQEFYEWFVANATQTA